MSRKRNDDEYLITTVRMTESLRKRIRDAARARDVSVNSEMLERLEATFAANWVERERESAA